MDNRHLYYGYDEWFLDDNTGTRIKVSHPILGQRFSNDVAPVIGRDDGMLNYIHYSLKLSKSRKFAIYTATNIDGGLFRSAICPTSWSKDKRAKEFQHGYELYKADKSDFDRGHMAKREDVQWGSSLAVAQEAVNITFRYSNAVPQHRELNQKIWKRLENYILHTETRKKALKICVFTGPVLSRYDPPFVTEVRGNMILLPTLFWKVVFYLKEDGNLYRAGFMMSQRQLLIDKGIVEELEVDAGQEELFQAFDDAATYQVNVSFIEKISNLQFASAIDVYQETRGEKLILEDIEVDPDLESLSQTQFLGFSIKNIKL